MGSIKNYFNETIYLWNDGYVLEAIFRIMIPLLLLSICFWIMSAVISFIFKIVLPVFIVFLIISYITKR